MQERRSICVTLLPLSVCFSSCCGWVEGQCSNKACSRSAPRFTAHAQSANTHLINTTSDMVECTMYKSVRNETRTYSWGLEPRLLRWYESQWPRQRNIRSPPRELSASNNQEHFQILPPPPICSSDIIIMFGVQQYNRTALGTIQSKEWLSQTVLLCFPPTPNNSPRSWPRQRTSWEYSTFLVFVWPHHPYSQGQDP